MAARMEVLGDRRIWAKETATAGQNPGGVIIFSFWEKQCNARFVALQTLALFLFVCHK